MINTTWKRTRWKYSDMEEEIPLEKIAEGKFKTGPDYGARKIYLGWKNKKCCHFIKYAGYIYVSTSHIEYTLKH